MTIVRKFGRLVKKDERDRKFLMPRRTALAARVTRRCWHAYAVLDQGETSECEGYSSWGWLAAGPVVNLPKFTPDWIYKEAKKIDGDNEEGTTGRSVWQVLQGQGYIKQYLWAFDATTVVEHLLTTGPVQVGTNWYKDMMEVGKDGFLRVSGDNQGGHAYLLIGADMTRNAVRMVNSWGYGWGEHGRAWLAIPDLTRLMREDGEASVADEVKVAAYAATGMVMREHDGEAAYV